MNLDTLTLAPDNTRPEPNSPIEAAAQQLVDHITNIITTEHATRTHDTHEAETRATNAEREYTRLCHAHEELLTEHEATLKELARLQRGVSTPAAGALTAAPADTPTSSPLPTTGIEQPE